MTEAQASALTALQWTGTASISSATSLPLAMHRRIDGCVHWKTARWLCSQGLARPFGVDPTGRRRVKLTASGKRKKSPVEPWNRERVSPVREPGAADEGGVLV